MKICFILASPPGYSETFLLSKLNGLHQKGHKVYYSSGAEASPLLQATHIPGFSKGAGFRATLRLIRNLMLDLFHPRVLWRFIRLEKAYGRSNTVILRQLLLNAHLFHHRFHWIHYEFGTLILGNENVAKALGAKCALSFRGFDITIYPLKFPGCYARAWQRLDKVHVISESIHALARNAGLPSHIPVQKIFPAADLLKFSPSKDTFPDAFKLLTVGRLHWIKGYQTAIEAIAILKQRGVNVSLTFAGTGRELERLKFLALDLDVYDRIHFQGKVSHEKLPVFMQQFSVYIQPSLEEGFCNSVIEAQASGLFCIVSDAGGLPENVLHNQTGFVVPKRDAEALATAIQQAKHLSPDERYGFMQRAQQHVQTHFDLTEQLSRFDAFYTL